LEVGVADGGRAQGVELVVAPHPGEGDVVVDLADLVQGAGRVLSADQHAVVVDDGGQAPTPGDPLAGVVGPVLHHLLGRDIERHGHAGWPSEVLRWMRALKRSATSVSLTRSKPSAVTVATVG